MIPRIDTALGSFALALALVAGIAGVVIAATSPADTLPARIEGASAERPQLASEDGAGSA